MARRRNKVLESARVLTNGPGKLVQALGLGRAHNRQKITARPLYIRAAPSRRMFVNLLPPCRRFCLAIECFVNNSGPYPKETSW